MICLEKKELIKAPIDTVTSWFYNMGQNYHDWHPLDHLGFKIISGSAQLQEGSVMQFSERLGTRSLKYALKINRVIPNRKIEWQATFPFSLVNLHGNYSFEEVNEMTYWKATLCFGWPVPILGRLLDTLGNRFILRKEVIIKHFEEEGEYLKQAIERQQV